MRRRSGRYVRQLPADCCAPGVIPVSASCLGSAMRCHRPLDDLSKTEGPARERWAFMVLRLTAGLKVGRTDLPLWTALSKCKDTSRVLLFRPGAGHQTATLGWVV